jgi:hypothetical protein
MGGEMGAGWCNIFFVGLTLLKPTDKTNVYELHNYQEDGTGGGLRHASVVGDGAGSK